jgi:NAD(P)H-hydrate repair Nnr-like enzyme with NAD(P)H-hydrate dehydratase domain
MSVLTQQPGNDLFPEIAWSKPENKALAGHLLIIGGNKHSIQAPVEAYNYADIAGAGTITVALPDATKKMLPPGAPNLEFGGSNPSGSFSQQAHELLSGLLRASDATLFCGDLGRNSETAIVLERLLEQSGLIICTKDSVDYFVNAPELILNRENTVIVASFAQIQKLAKNSQFFEPLLFSDSALVLANKLAKLTVTLGAHIIFEKNCTIFLASRGEVIVTNFKTSFSKWRTKLASEVAVWTMQNKNNVFKASATAIAHLTI